MVNPNSLNGFHIYGWMVTDLHLEGGDLFAFGVIYGFIQSYAGTYRGNTAYLSAWTGWSEKTSRSHLASLVEKGLIVEERGRENNTPFCRYKLAPDFYEKHPVKITASPGKNFPDHPEKTSESTRKKLPGEYKYIEKNIENRRDEPFIPPTIEKVSAYCAERGNGIDAATFVNYYQSKGWKVGNTKMKDWKAAVRTWEAKNRNELRQQAKKMTIDTYKKLLFND